MCPSWINSYKSGKDLKEEYPIADKHITITIKIGHARSRILLFTATI